MKEIAQYHLHKNDPSKLHFEINKTKNYLHKNKEKATKPHRHSFYQLIWFKNAGKHFVDYKIIEHPANTFFFLNKNQIHYFCSESSNTGYLFHFNDFFIGKSHPELLDRFSISIFNEIGNNYVLLTDSVVYKITLLLLLIEGELEMKEYSFQEQVLYHFLVILIEVERLKKNRI